MSMNSREQALTVLDYQEPDRVPIDFGGTRVTSIHPAPLDKLRLDNVLAMFESVHMHGQYPIHL